MSTGALADEYLTINQVSELLHVGTTTLSDWRSNQEGPPFVKVGRRRVLYRRSEVEAWLQRPPTRATA